MAFVYHPDLLVNVASGLFQSLRWNPLSIRLFHGEDSREQAMGWLKQI